VSSLAKAQRTIKMACVVQKLLSILNFQKLVLKMPHTIRESDLLKSSRTFTNIQSSSFLTMCLFEVNSCWPQNCQSKRSLFKIINAWPRIFLFSCQNNGSCFSFSYFPAKITQYVNFKI
jgi:hypothetical protein